MRSEQQMLDLILGTARQDERIRAVILNGSRANPNAQRDPFQDFDVVYIVTNVEPYRHNLRWIERFGERMILQLPNEMGYPSPEKDASVVYLMQFMDGNRIDLSIRPLTLAADAVADSQSLVLLEKDDLIGLVASASDRDYLPSPPTGKAFADCCNEFWWVSPYVAKGLWRGEILYAKHCMDHYVRDELMKMIDWYVGIDTSFSRSTGKCGKYLQRMLEAELWDMLMKTYCDAGYENTWAALDSMCDLFRRLAVRVGEHFGYEYPHEDDRRVSVHLDHVRKLPSDASEIY